MNASNTEILEIVDSNGKVIGQADRRTLHSDPSLLHRVVHVLIFNTAGELLLQKRSLNKDIAPGKWDTSVGGHLNPGEDVEEAAEREMQEELGISGLELDYLHTYIFSNHRESELVTTFRGIHDGPFAWNKEEIDEVRFWQLRQITESSGKGIFSRHFEEEIKNYLKLTRQ